MLKDIPKTEIVFSQITLKFKEWDRTKIDSVITECGGTPIRFTPAIKMVIEVPKDTPPMDILQAYLLNDAIDFADFSKKGQRTSVPYHAATNDTRLDECWHLKRMNAFHAWKYTKGSSAVRVTFADSGFTDHHDLQGLITSGLCYNPVTNDHSDTAYFDINWNWGGTPYSHGTNCTSCMLANNNNNEGVSGVCPSCKLVALAITDDEGNFTSAELADGMVWAVDNGARVIGISLAMFNDGDTIQAGYVCIQDAVDYATAHECVVTCATGNGNYDLDYQLAVNHCWWVPAQLNNVIAVGGSQEDDGRAIYTAGISGSHYGTPVDLVAPGKHIGMASVETWDVAYPNLCTAYEWYNGTSFSSPLAAAVFGLVFSINPDLTAQEAIDIVRGTTDASADPTFAAQFPNAGIANAAKAVLKALTTVAANAGVIYPYVMFRGAGASVTVTDGVAETNLNGNIIADLRGYSSDTITNVQLWIGNALIYSGPEALISITASNTGSSLPVKVIAETANGLTEETYSDIIVSSVEGAISQIAYNLGHNTMVTNPGHNPMVTNPR